MSTIINRINEQLAAKNVDPTSAFGRSWLLQKIRSLTPTAKDRMEIIRNREAQRNRTAIGRFYFFFYNPKTKESLPYWDRFPMVIVLQRYHDGFLGLNLHYVYPKDRLILLAQLKRFATGPLTDEATRLRLSYPLLKALHQAYRATPCIKRYLAGHVQSRFIEIPPSEWEVASTLPMQDFRAQVAKTHNDALIAEAQAHKARLKARQGHVSKEQVWAESKEKY